MKKILFLSILMLSTTMMSAQQYEVVSRSNDTIKLYAGGLGAAAKSLIPGAAAAEPTYRMIKKTANGQESILFLDFVNIVDKLIVSYETDMVTPGKFTTKTHGIMDVFKALTRVNALYLEGEYLGMKVEAYQRPLPYKDIFYIDGVQMMLPVKLVEVESKLAEAVAKATAEAEEAAAKEAMQVTLTEEELMELAKDPANIAFVAMLMKSQSFKREYAEECKRLFDWDKVIQCLSKDEAELYSLSRNHHKYFNKYR